MTTNTMYNPRLDSRLTKKESDYKCYYWDNWGNTCRLCVI